MNTLWKGKVFVWFCTGDSGDESDESESEEKSSSESETEKSSEESSGISSEEEKVALIFVHCCLQLTNQQKLLYSIQFALYWIWCAWQSTIHTMFGNILVCPKKVLSIIT